ncbi:MAG TPA: saccharopine dehydrogenase [Bacteroidetes bacterium]|nr:saccharopine dehydrogenase [Bacteroidota bacterium]
MSTHITVLGSGLVGSAIIKDLAKDSTTHLLAVDISQRSLHAVENLDNVETRVADVNERFVLDEVIGNADLVICAVPGFMGFKTLKGIIENGKHVVDISFFPEDGFELTELAEKHGVVAVVDCGVAPGLSNIQAGWAQTKMDTVESYLCYVGGLPRVRTWPFEYKAVFSPIDVIEEYTRPARFVEFGELVTREALSGIEKLDLPGVGTLEAFNSDGLRSLIFTLDAPFKKEMTLRYAGHAELMRVFREMGLFDEQPVSVKGQDVAPIDLTTKLLFDAWKLKEGEEDLTVMQVIMEGKEGGDHVRYTFDLLDFFDTDQGVHSMARTTGYTCTLVARMVLSGQYARVGISPPEYVGQVEGCYDQLKEGYAKRGIRVTETREVLS